MKKSKKLIAKAVKKTVNHMVDSELYTWPPLCTGFFFQPVRPKKIEGAEKSEVQKKAGE